MSTLDPITSRACSDNILLRFQYLQTNTGHFHDNLQEMTTSLASLPEDSAGFRAKEETNVLEKLFEMDRTKYD